jgi:hypothetical protein
MRKFLLLLMIPAMSWAFDDNPTKPFDATKRLRDTSVITWRVVDDVQKACDEERQSTGAGKYPYKVNACVSFYLDKNTCLIITGKKTSMHTLGHEVRHCFQGHWH